MKTLFFVVFLLLLLSCFSQPAKVDSSEITYRFYRIFSKYITSNKDTANQLSSIFFEYAIKYRKVLRCLKGDDLKEVKDSAKRLTNDFYDRIEQRFGKTIREKVKHILTPPPTVPIRYSRESLHPRPKRKITST